MKSRFTVGLMIALLAGAITAVPSLAKPDNGTLVEKGFECSVDGSVLGLDIPVTTMSRWVEKRNGQVSKLKCRFVGVDMTDWTLEKRSSEAECTVPEEFGEDWEVVRSRLKVNHRGNGWLKCSFRAVE